MRGDSAPPAVPDGGAGRALREVLALLMVNRKRSAYLLKHLYSGLSHASLKGADPAAVNLLVHYARAAGWGVDLAIVELKYEDCPEYNEKYKD